MIVGGVVALIFGVDAERKSLESITSPLSVVPPGKGGRVRSDEASRAPRHLGPQRQPGPGAQGAGPAR